MVSMTRTIRRKTFLAGLTVLLAVATLAGCATTNSGTTTSGSDTNSAVENGTLTTRTITFPSIYFQNKTADEVKSSLEGQGCTDIVANEDGSYTATMPLDKYNSLVDTMHTQIKKELDEMPNSDSFPNISKITYDDQFANISVNLSVDQIGLQDVYDGYAAALPSLMYQQIAGQPVKCSVIVIGAGGETLSSSVYPDDMKSSTTSS